MSKKLLIILADADPSDASQFSAPLFQVTVAAAMSYEAEVVLTGWTSVLASQGKAQTIEINHDTHRTLHDAIGSAYVVGETMDDDTVTFTY